MLTKTYELRIDEALRAREALLSNAKKYRQDARWLKQEKKTDQSEWAIKQAEADEALVEKLLWK